MTHDSIDDLFSDSPRGSRSLAVTAENCSVEFCLRVLRDLDDGNFEVNDCEAQFINSISLVTTLDYRINKEKFVTTWP